MWDVREFDAAELASLKKEVAPDVKEKLDEIAARQARTTLPLSFLAQINLADVARIDHGLPLPKDGLMSFSTSSASRYGDMI